MKDYDFEIIDENIKESIKMDSLGRNSKLNKLVELLNGMNKNRIISINGKWGCGKTVFLKQLEYINKNVLDTSPSINEDNIKSFRETYDCYYYNAWENDFHESPLLSLIYNLINDFYNEQDQTVSGKVELPLDFKGLLKTITYDFVDLEKVKTYKDLTSEIYTANEKRDALNRLIDSILPENKRLLFIVDELDRCRPDYAINMLEVIKHFYTNDRIIFILGTNNKQLSYTISNYYGRNFDGYGYLNKIYNLVIEIDNISSKKYLDVLIQNKSMPDWCSNSLYAVCDYLKFSMREINRFLNDYELIMNYFNSSYSSSFIDDTIVKYLFLPYCLGLKIYDIDILSAFLDGNGYSQFEQFVFSDDNMTGILKRCYREQRNAVPEDENKGAKEFLNKKYSIYFVNKTNDWQVNEIKRKFLDVFSLLSNYSSISVDSDS